MLATIWERLQEDPIHVLVLCGSAAGSVLLFGLVLRLLLARHDRPAHQDGEEPKLVNQE